MLYAALAQTALLDVVSILSVTLVCTSSGHSVKSHSVLGCGCSHILRPSAAGLLCDLLWADPDKEIQGWGENDRGVSYTFGPDSVSEFLTKHDLDLVCRAHQVSSRAAAGQLQGILGQPAASHHVWLIAKVHRGVGHWLPSLGAPCGHPCP